MSAVVDGYVVAPERSIVQRMDALKLANETRTLRGLLKRDIKAGTVDAAGTLEAPPAWALTMRVSDLLEAIPGWGEVKSAKALLKANASRTKTLRGLTARQRGEIVSMIRRGALPR